jgi:hypothetical protein
VRLRLGLRHPADPLERGDLVRLDLLQVLLELAEVRLTIGDALVSARELCELVLNLGFLCEDALLDLHDLRPALGDFGLDLGPDFHGLLARLDLRFSPERVGVALRILEELAPDLTCFADTRDAEPEHRHERAGDSNGDADDKSDREHGVLRPVGSQPRRCRGRSPYRGRAGRPRFRRDLEAAQRQLRLANDCAAGVWVVGPKNTVQSSESRFVPRERGVG